MCGVGRDVPSLVVCMKHQIEAHGFLEILTLVDAQHLREVGGPVQFGVVLWELPIVEGASVDLGRDDGDLGDHIEAILQGVGPIVILLHALLILLEKLGVLLQGQHSD